MIYGLIFLEHTRLSAKKQRADIVQFAKLRNLSVNKFIEFAGNPDISIFKSGDVIICHSWGCLCEDRAFLRRFIKYLLANNVFLYSVTSKYCIDDIMNTGVLKYAFDLYEDIRFNFVSNKNIRGARQRVANGHAPGRPHGAKGQRHVMDGKENDALTMHRNGFSMYAISKKLGVSTPTIKRFFVAQNVM